MAQKKLTRSVSDRKVAGVCGGLGEYFNMDPLVFRVIFLFLFFFGGTGLILYIFLWILMPEKNDEPAEESGYSTGEIISDVVETAEVIGKIINHSHKHKKPVKKHRGVLWGLLIVVVGFLLLGKSFGLFEFYWCNIFKLWPVLIIWIGIALLPIGRVWKSVCSFVLLAIAVALLFMLSLKSCHHPFWKYFWNDKYGIEEKSSNSECYKKCIEDFELDIDTETIIVTANGDSIVIDQNARQGGEKVVIKKVIR
ncbi:MAG: PspC domain-containing protein [Bacteroidetes bacterium]|nr:PspC domain-containing protein [Bacteroidota bacterium]MCL2302643.1 PspC domain-containing protein [Lentimicrobiaceae bacterium]